MKRGTVDQRSRHQQQAAVAAAAFLLFNYPLLAVFDIDARVLGVPVLWAYLFTVWALLIALVAWLIRGV